jgi:hypothetical protein
VSLAPDAYGFSHQPDGSKPIRPDGVSHRFAKLAQRLGVRCRLHDLRLMSVARTGLPHTDRTQAAEDRSTERDATATAVGQPQLPAPDHSTAGGNGSRPPRDSRARVRDLVARERATGTRLHARDVAAAAGSANAAPMSCCAPSAPKGSSHDPRDSERRDVGHTNAAVSRLAWGMGAPHRCC